MQWILLSGFLLWACVSLGQASNLSTATARLAADPQLARGSLGLAVVDLQTGELLEAVNAERSFVPASLLKVVTVATALTELGPDFHFTTRLGYAGEVLDGTLQGDLIVLGAGDPSLGAGRPEGTLSLDSLLERWVSTLRRAGITRIEGSVIVNDSGDPGAEPSPFWQWNDIGNYYGAGAGAFMVHENYYTLRLQRTASVGGRPRIVGMRPDPGELVWDNQLRSGSSRSGDRSYIYGAPASLDRAIRGTIPAGEGIFEVKGSLPDPSLAFADWLTAALEDAAVEVTGSPGTQHVPTELDGTLDSLHSPPLAVLAELTNFKSVNLYAEALYKALARHWSSGNDPTEIGERLVDFWRARGVPTEGWEQLDGCGLSMGNLVTPAQLAQVLRLAQNEGLPATLPRVGQEGTVRRLLRDRPAAARIRAKSGTLRRARGFCGYATNGAGRQLAFVVLANNYSGSGGALRRDMADWLAALAE